LLCRHHGCELEIPLYPPYRFLRGDYGVFDCRGMAFSAASLKPLVRVCSNLRSNPKLKARDIVGYGVLQLAIRVPVVFFLCWLFAQYIPTFRR
jgi:hypothetical protein